MWYLAVRIFSVPSFGLEYAITAVVAFNWVLMKSVAFFTGEFQRLQGVWSWEQPLWGHDHH